MSEQVTQIAQTAVMQPGDTLIVRVAQNTSRDAVANMMTAFKELLPDVQVRIVAAEELAIYRPETGE